MENFNLVLGNFWEKNVIHFVGTLHSYYQLKTLCVCVCLHVCVYITPDLNITETSITDKITPDHIVR